MATLEEQQRRVERAQDALVDDVRQLGRVRRQMGSKVALIAGGAALVGVLLVRSAVRRRRYRYRVTGPRSSVIGDAFRVIVLELVRQVVSSVGPRLLSGAIPAPRLTAVVSRPASEPSSPQQHEAEPD